MSRANRKPLTPDSLAADGIQGADAKALGPSDAKHRRLVIVAHVLVMIDTAREELERYALETDKPANGIVECADFLDHARDALVTP